MVCLSIHQSTSCSEAPQSRPWCWEEQKHQSWSSPPRSSHSGRGRAAKGEAPYVLDSIRQSARPPLGTACKKKKKGKEMGLQACLTKTFNRDLCPCWIHLISQLSECWSSQTVSLQIWGGTDFFLTWAGVRKKKILSKAKQSVPFFCCSLCWWVFGEQTDQEQPSANLQGWKTKPTEHAKNCHSLNDHLRQAPKAN